MTGSAGKPTAQPRPRFWAPRGGEPIALTAEGYLREPDQHFWNTALRTTNDAVAGACTVLLGEPGAGKTTVSRAIAAAGVLDDDRVVVRIDLGEFTTDVGLRSAVSDTLSTWRIDAQAALVVFDGFDECVRHVPTAGRLLAGLFARHGHPALSVAILSQPFAWPSEVENALAESFDAVAVWELAPLLVEDVEAYVAGEGVPSATFRSSVEALGVGWMAARPITLQMLVAEFKRAGSVSSALTSQAALYARAALTLCDEWDAGLAASPRVNSAVELNLVATRIAAAMVLSGTDRIWDGPSVQCPAGAFDLAELNGGVEAEGDLEVAVDSAALREVMATGLFTARGPGLYGFVHQSYQDFLAASALARRPPTDVRSWILAASGAPWEVLQGVVAWLLVLRPPEYEDLVATDPMLFATSQVGIPEPIRATVIEGLLAASRSGKPTSLDEAGQGALGHSGLAGQINPVIEDTSENTATRLLAIQFAQFADESVLDPLNRLAAELGEPEELRSTAIGIIVQKGGASRRAGLLPLVTSPGDDPYDEVKGAALDATLGFGLDVAGALHALTPPKSTYSGRYRSFLGRTLPSALQPADAEVLLDWMLAHAGEGAWPPAEFENLHENAVRVVWSQIQEPGVRLKLAKLLSSRPEHHPLVAARNRRGSPLPAMPATARRSVVSLIVGSVSDDWRILESGLPLLDADDVEWLMQAAEAAHEAGQDDAAEAFVGLLHSRFDARLSAHCHAVDAVQEDTWLYGKFAAGWREPIKLDSPYARLRRKARTDPAAVEGEHLDAEQLRARYSGLIDDAHADITAKWPELNLWMTVKPATGRGYDFAPDITQMPGWQLIDDDQRASLLPLAKRYLEETDFDVAAVLGQDRASRIALSAYRAAALLQRLASNLLDELDADVWRRWAGVFVDYRLDDLKPEPTIVDQTSATYDDPLHHAFTAAVDVSGDAVTVSVELDVLDQPGEPRTMREVLLHRASTAAPDAVRDAVRVLIERSPDRGELLLRYGLPLSDDEMLALVAGGIKDSNPAQVNRQLFEVLLSHDAAQATAVADGLCSPTPPRPAWAADGISAALRSEPARFWTAFWSTHKVDPDFVVRTLDQVGPSGTWMLERLGSSDLAELFRWLPSHLPALPELRTGDSVPPGWHATINVFQRIPDVLASRADASAVVALQEIAAAGVVEPRWIARCLDQAERGLRAATRVPCTAAQAAALLRDSRRRTAHNAHELAAAVVESLARLQRRLNGQVTPQAFALWDETQGRPKVENRLSDYTTDHLRFDLAERNFIIDREIEVFNRKGTGSGVRTDIQVQAKARDQEALAVTIEAKGVWNQDLMTAMRDQLVNQYLQPTGRTHGVYLVFWFDPTQWNKQDSRWVKRPINDLRSVLEAQAAELAAEGWHIDVVILDGSLPATDN